MKLVKLATASVAVVSTTAAIQLKTPDNLNLNQLNHQQEQVKTQLQEQQPIGINEKKINNRPIRTPFLNHQLNVDHMEILNRIHNPRSLENMDEKPYIDEDSKDEKAPFLPPVALPPVEVDIEPSLDSAEDEAPIMEEPSTVDESTQTTEPEISPIVDLPPPKMKPAPKEKPAPGSPLENPPIMNKPPPLKEKPAPVEVISSPGAEVTLAPGDKTPPKSKPAPRSLLSFLGYQDEPLGKPKPAPKEKPMPQLTPSQPVANAPDILPFPMFSQPNENTVLRAKMNLLSSPHSEDYSDEAYVTIQAVQDYCASDYTKYCSPMFMMNSIRSPFEAPMNIIPFGKWSKDDDEDVENREIFFVGMVNSIFDIFNSVVGGSTSVVVVNVDDDETPLKPKPCPKSNQIPGVNQIPVPEQIQPPHPQDRLLHESHHSEQADPHGPDARFFRGGPKAKPGPRGGPRMWGPHENHNWDHSNSGSDSSSSSTQFDLSNPAPTFLGYGQDGDMCLMANYDSLSISCQSAIDDAYALRDEYVSEEGHGNGCAFAAGVFATLALVAIVLCLAKNRRQKLISTLKAIHNDPELKARVEAASGIPVPQPCCAQNNSQPCRGRKCVIGLFRVLLTLALSFFLVHMAASFTLAIVNGMVSTDEETGETVGPTPVSVLLIFISFLLVEILMIVAFKRCLAGCIARRRQGAYAASGTSSSPTPPGNHGFGRYFAAIPLPSRRFSFFRSNPANNGYSPLMTDEENNTEMIQSPTVVASAPLQPQIVYVPPTMPSHVAAQSISSVSMI